MYHQNTNNMNNLFTKSKNSAPKTSKKTPEKVQVRLNDQDFFEKVEMLEKLNDTLKSAKSQADMISDEIKEISKNEWLKLYNQTGKNPGSIYVESHMGDRKASVFLVPSDKYISVNADRASVLQEKYGDEIIEENTVFSFDNDMIAKYGEILSELIMNCDLIDENDKERIIKAKVDYSVSKGTIDKMKSFGNVNEVMDEVKPVIALKNVEVVENSK